MVKDCLQKNLEELGLGMEDTKIGRLGEDEFVLIKCNLLPLKTRALKKFSPTTLPV